MDDNFIVNNRIGSLFSSKDFIEKAWILIFLHMQIRKQFFTKMFTILVYVHFKKNF